MRHTDFDNQRAFWNEELDFLAHQYERYGDNPVSIVMYFDELLQRASTMEKDLKRYERDIRRETKVLRFKEVISRVIPFSRNPADEYRVHQKWLGEIGEFQRKLQWFVAYCGDVADGAKSGMDAELQALGNADSLEAMLR